MPRGQLIFPFIVELGLLDTAATAADPDGVGPLASGYDDEFRETVIRSGVGSVRGESARVERVQRFFAQVEDDAQGSLSMGASGNMPVSRITLVFHYEDLEALGAVQSPAGKPIIKAPGARLISIRNPDTGELIERYDSPPGFWATEAKSGGFGLGPNRNLLIVVFQERAQGILGSGT